MVHRWLSPSTCKEKSIQRALHRVQKGVIEQIYNNPMSNNQRRKIFYDVLNNPRCRTGQPKFLLWTDEELAYIRAVYDRYMKELLK